ncbi:thioesterase family protein [Thalassobacillus hwangdonensis]|uniref:Thioesterase family protein n=1 Tax=Thalassobacillus hwangdonensis TaxID=546108 RepID=A0ABW3KZT6_9BACI
MKPGMEIGQKATHTITVTDEMFASFEGEVVHPTYSTVSMVYHMEWTARKIILPFLEEDEEGMGAAVNIKHVRPAPKGSTIIVTAELTKIKENVVLTEMTAESEGELVGLGEVKQVILPKKKIKQMLMAD